MYWQAREDHRAGGGPPLCPGQRGEQIGASRDMNASLQDISVRTQAWEGQAAELKHVCTVEASWAAGAPRGGDLAGAGCHVSAMVGMSQAPGVLAALTDLSLFSQARRADGNVGAHQPRCRWHNTDKKGTYPTAHPGTLLHLRVTPQHTQVPSACRSDPIACPGDGHAFRGDDSEELPSEC